MSRSEDWPLDCYRPYLRLLAGLHLVQILRGKLDPSDAVQETLLKAHEHRPQFRGQTEAEWAGFLRRILANTLADQARHFARDKRDLALERSLEGSLEESAARLEGWLASKESSPSERLIRQERLLGLAEALGELPEAQRTALEMRYLQDPPGSVAEIAARLERSEKAVAGLLCRGLEKLRDLLDEKE